MSFNRVSAAILAGGLGTRMGNTEKGLIHVGTATIVEILLEKLSPLFEDVFLVTKTPDKYYHLGIRVETDVLSARSSLTGIHSAIHHAKKSHVFVTACDMPFLNTRVVDLLLSKMKDYPPDVVIPVLDEKRYQPLCSIYSKRCLAPIEEQILREDFKIIRFFPKVKVVEVPQTELILQDPDLFSFFNINTPEQRDKARDMVVGFENAVTAPAQAVKPADEYEKS